MAAPRKSIYLSSFGHANPIPAASQIGPFLYSGALTGRDPFTGEMPPSLDSQCVNVFGHVRAIMEAAGASTDHIIKMNFWLVDYRDRSALNREWTEMFPIPESRPARQVVNAILDGGALVHCDLVAVLG